MKRFRFQSITTETFCAFVERMFPGLLAKVDAPAWLDKPGLPAGAPRFVSARLEDLTAQADAWKDGRRPDPAAMRAWPTAELLVFLQHVPRELSQADCAWLDDNLKLTARGNYEILAQWLAVAAASGYQPAFDRVRLLLSTVGRMKYVRPLYQALGKTPVGRALAREVFASAAPTYHALTRRAAESVMAKYAA
jgi:leukotriene-A4 hydrolase